MRGLALLILSAAGCQATAGDVEIQEVRVLSTIEDTTVAVELANIGPVPTWIHTWPHHVSVDKNDDRLTIALHADVPTLQEAPSYLTPVIRYERLARGSNPFALNEHVVEIVVSNQLGPKDARVFVPDVSQITVEVAWHEKNPGSFVTLAEAPAPVDLATYTWAKSSP